MQLALKTVSRLGLILTVVPPLLFLAGIIELSTGKWIMLVGTVFWFSTAPILQKQHDEDAPHASPDPL